MRLSSLNPRKSLPALALLAAAWSAQSTAATFITMRGVVDGTNGSFEVSGDTTGVDNSGSLHGFLVEDILGPGGATVAPGLLPACPAGCGQSIGATNIVGEIDTSLGRLRAISQSTSSSTFSSSSEITLQLQDLIVAQTTGDIHFQLHLDAIFGAPTTPDKNPGSAALAFGLFVSTTGFQEFPGQPAAGIDYDSSGAIALPHNLSFDRDFVMSNVTAGTKLFMTLQLNADSACGSAEGLGNCEAFVDAAHTAYLGISGDVESSSGYHYAPYAPVPLPASVLLFGSGLLGLSRWRADATRRPS